MRRSKERIAEIDSYLRENYPKDGGRVCSEALSEKIGYIQSRVQILRITKDVEVNKKREAADMSRNAILSGKITAKNREIEQLMDLLKHQKKLNKELRDENIRLIKERIDLKRAYNKRNT